MKRTLALTPLLFVLACSPNQGGGETENQGMVTVVDQEVVQPESVKPLPKPMTPQEIAGAVLAAMERVPDRRLAFYEYKRVGTDNGYRYDRMLFTVSHGTHGQRAIVVYGKPEPWENTSKSDIRITDADGDGQCERVERPVWYSETKGCSDEVNGHYYNLLQQAISQPEYAPR